VLSKIMGTTIRSYISQRLKRATIGSLVASIPIASLKDSLTSTDRKPSNLRYPPFDARHLYVRGRRDDRARRVQCVGRPEVDEDSHAQGERDRIKDVEEGFVVGEIRIETMVMAAKAEPQERIVFERQRDS
jgi:hypothetical protein